jgi:serralysin
MNLRGIGFGLLLSLILWALFALGFWTAYAYASTSICTESTCTGSSSNTMIGTSEPDLIYGDRHANTLRGKGSYDYLWGYGGNDTLEGGNGRDSLRGGRGEDLLSGMGGNDTINAREKGARQRTDWIFCGSGLDTVLTVKGGVDYIDPDCERVVT